MHDFLCPQALVSGTHSLVLLACFPSIGVPVPLRLPKSTRQKKKKMATPVSLFYSISLSHLLTSLAALFP